MEGAIFQIEEFWTKKSWICCVLFCLNPNVEHLYVKWIAPSGQILPNNVGFDELDPVAALGSQNCTGPGLIPILMRFLPKNTSLRVIKYRIHKMWRSTWKYSESHTGSTSCVIVATLPPICIHLSIYPSIHLSTYIYIYLSIYPSIYLSIYLLPLFATPPAKGHARHDGQEDRHNGNRLCSARGSLVLSPGSNRFRST